MGWYQTCIAEIVFCKTNFHDEDDVQSEIDKNNDLIKCFTDQISHYVGIPLRELKEDDETLEVTLDRIHKIIDECIKEIIELSSYNERLSILKENWHLRDGDYVCNPDYKKNIKEFAKENILPSIKWQEKMKKEREEK